MIQVAACGAEWVCNTVSWKLHSESANVFSQSQYATFWLEKYSSGIIFYLWTYLLFQSKSNVLDSEFVCVRRLTGPVEIRLSWFCLDLLLNSFALLFSLCLVFWFIALFALSFFRLFFISCFTLKVTSLCISLYFLSVSGFLPLLITCLTLIIIIIHIITLKHFQTINISVHTSVLTVIISKHLFCTFLLVQIKTQPLSSPTEMEPAAFRYARVYLNHETQLHMYILTRRNVSGEIRFLWFYNLMIETRFCVDVM